MDERLVVGSPVGDFELLFCHVISLQDQECDDLLLTTAKISIYSTKPHRVVLIKDDRVSCSGCNIPQPLLHFNINPAVEIKFIIQLAS